MFWIGRSCQIVVLITIFFPKDIKDYNFVMKYNDSAYAKLSMAPLWAELLGPMLPFVDMSASFSPSAPKLSVVSGHDTTIMPLLGKTALFGRTFQEDN